MNYMEYIAMPPAQKLAYRLASGIRGLPRALGKAAAAIGRALGRGILAFIRGISSFFTTFARGDLWTRLSYVLMGSGALFRGQIIKGFGFLALEAAFITYIRGFGAEQLSLLSTLGKSAKKEIWNEKDQIFNYVQGDNSMLILLFGVMTLLVIGAFIWVYLANIRLAYRNQKERAEGHRLPSFAEDIRMLFDRRLHVTFLALPTIGVLMFTILPLIFMILIAFTSYDSSHQPPGSLFTWVGLENFRNIFYNNPVKSATFSGVFSWTVTWAFFATVSNYLLGLILALMINRKGIRFKKFWRTVFIITIAVPQFVSLLLMSRLLADQGAINVMLGYLGIAPVQFLTSPTLARITVIVINIWVGIPYTMLITSGVLMNIPAELYESARIDGAGTIKTFTRITMPYTLFVTTPYLITQFIGNMNNFNVIYLLSGGGPLSLDYYQAGKTDLLVTWLYKLTVNNQDYNLASAIGIIIFVISAVFSLIVYNMSSSSRKEESFQ